MTVRKKVGMCIARYDEVSKESKVHSEWLKIKKENFNLLAKAFYLTMLQYDNFGDERFDKIETCLEVDFTEKKGGVYFINLNPRENVAWMIYPLFLQLHYLVHVLYREYYSRCEDFFYISELYYKYTKGKLPEQGEVMEGKEKYERFNETEYANFLDTYESYFTLGGKMLLRTFFQDICISVINMEYVVSNSDSKFHTAA